MTVRYRTGSAAVLVSSQGVVATDRAHASVLAGLAGTDLAVLPVIDALSGGALAALPGFACVVAEAESLRVVVRGDFTVSAAGQVWSGANAATWREDTVSNFAGVEVVITIGAPTDDLELPIEAGIVLASRLSWSTGDPAPSSAAEAAPEPLVRPLVQPVAEPLAPAEPGLVDPVEDFGHEFDAMFGATVVGRRPEDAAVRDTVVPTSVAGESEVDDPASPPGDHDGMTITLQQFEALRAAEESRTARACVVMPTGIRHDVAPRLLIGRRPLARGVSRTDVPTLVTVDDPYVSATHLEVALHGDTVVVTDMSSNGTLMTRPGDGPAMLTKAVPTEVEDGTRLALSDEVTVTVEVEVPR